MVVLCCVVAFPLGGGGHRVQVWWGGLSPVVCPLAVWGSPAWSLDRPPGVFQYVGRAGLVLPGAWGPLGRGVRDWSVATRGVWSCGAWGCRPTIEWAQWCRVLRSRGPRVGGSRLSCTCCGTGAVPAGGEWRCVAGVYRSHGWGGAICSGVGWARGRLPAGSGCRGLTVDGYSAVSPWCVPWWSLVGWLKGVFGVYRIHGGTIVCWGAAAVGAAGCGGGACVGVDRVGGGGVSCVVLGGSSCWSVVVGPGGWSWALRFLGGCGTCGVGLAGGGGARVWACVFAFCSPRGPFLCLSLTPLFSLACLALFFFFGGGGWGVVRGCGRLPVPAPVWAWVSWGTGVGWLLCSGFPACAPAPRLPVPRAPVRRGLTAGGLRQWWRGACVGGRGSWLVPGWRGRARARVWVCSWRGLMGWWAVWAWLVCVGVGYLCAEGAVGWAGAPWAMQWVEEMLVMPTGGCCRRRNGFVLLTWVLRVTRQAATGSVTLMVS